MITTTLEKSLATPDPETEAAAQPMADGMILTNEGGLHRENPSWALVERIVRELDAGEGNSFCCLSLPCNTYVQTLRGMNGYHLEWRESLSITEFTHYRASYPGAPEEAADLFKYDHYRNEGQARDLLQIEDVVDAFRAFHRGAGRPPHLNWRVYGA